jgi:diguanylate cyclase (GGDEF)-like protein
MGWRYNNTGLILTTIILSASYLALSTTSANNSISIPKAISFLLPINIVFYSFFTKKRLLSISGLLCLFFIFLQITLVGIFYRPAISQSTEIINLICNLFSITPEKMSVLPEMLKAFFLNNDVFHIDCISTPAIIAFFFSMSIVVLRMFLYRDIITAGYFGALISVFLGVISSNYTPDVPVYFMAAALILVITNIEASYFKAYVDELTGLPGRRGLNETMANLGKKYTIAMLDIDHFKKFNDTYGHKTGDDVLKMISSKFDEITGGPQTFRYGGEEFTAVFRGKSLDEAMPHLENFRYIIENSTFTVRDKSRKKGSRNDRGNDGVKKQLNVTISIGAASSQKNNSTPEKVIKAADKFLYKAKKAGRNCVRC